jgi:hypothetical protein
MALKPNLSFSSCDNPVIGIMSVDVRIKMTAALSAIAVRLLESIVPMLVYCWVEDFICEELRQVAIISATT